MLFCGDEKSEDNIFKVWPSKNEAYAFLNVKHDLWICKSSSTDQVTLVAKDKRYDDLCWFKIGDPAMEGMKIGLEI